MKIFKNITIILIILIIAIIIAISSFFVIKNKTSQINQIKIISQISGTINLNVENDYIVKKGEIIAKIEAEKYKNDLNSAKIKLENTQKKLKVSTNEIYKIKALYKNINDEIEIAKLNLDRANSDYILYRNAFRDEAVTKYDLSKAQKNLEKANSNYNLALKKQKNLNIKLAKINSAKTVQHDEIKKLMAEIDKIQQNIIYETIIAPIDGKIIDLKIKSGDFILENSEILTIIEE